MCVEHWKALQDAINARGLAPFVAKSGAEAARRMVGAGKFEPLSGAFRSIAGSAMEAVGLALMHPNDDGTERCPICFLITECKCGRPDCRTNLELWIDKAADKQLAEATRLGIVGAS